MAAWCKDAAPSDELRCWSGRDPAKWKEFQRCYWADLNHNPAACQAVLDAANRGHVALPYSAHDTEHNSGEVVLEGRLRGIKSWP
jgi:uncharacterized protein YeaO (DUF488 family)